MKEINAREIKQNAVSLIADDWALLTAGNKEKWNTMTVSWGGIGELWGKDVTFVFVRPQRYTKEFIDNSDYFTLSFFDDEYKDALKLCGRKSGRDIDKAQATGLTPAFDGEYKDALKLCGRKSGRDIDKAQATGLTPVFDGDTTYLEQAKLVIICKKIAVQPMDPNGILDKSIIDDCYTEGDFHTTYVGEIVKILEKD